MNSQTQPMRPTAIAPQPLRGWTGCFMGFAGGLGCYWPLAYGIAYMAAVEQVRQERLRQQWWEPNLN